MGKYSRALAIRTPAQKFTVLSDAAESLPLQRLTNPAYPLRVEKKKPK